MAELAQRKVVVRIEDSIIYDSGVVETQTVDAIVRWLETWNGSDDEMGRVVDPDSLDEIAKRIRAGEWRKWLPKPEKKDG